MNFLEEVFLFILLFIKKIYKINIIIFFPVNEHVNENNLLCCSIF